MAKTKQVEVDGVQYTLQSVSATWYYGNADKFGITGAGRKDSVGYMNAMFKNTVIEPAEVRTKGMAYFDERDDVAGPGKLLAEIESFLSDPVKPGGSVPAGKVE